MNELAPCYVPRDSTGVTLSEFIVSYNHARLKNFIHRTRDKLMSGQIQVAGDQWPLFLYANYSYDPEDPWNGLLRSGLLVSVRIFIFIFRHIDIQYGT